MVESVLSYFDRQEVSWIVSRFVPGKLIWDLSLHHATTLENGWDCGRPTSMPTGLGRIVQGHMRASDPRGLFVVGTAGGMEVARGGVAIAYGPVMASRDAPATRLPLPETLAGVSVMLSDAHGVARPAGENGGRAREALEDSPPEFRHWEWDFLMRQADQSLMPLMTGLDQLFIALFSPNGEQILSGRGDNIYELWEAQTGEKLRTFDMGLITKFARQVPAFTPDGRQLLISNEKETVVWDVATGKELNRFAQEMVRAFHVRGDRTIALVGDLDEFYRIWNLDPTVEDLPLRGLPRIIKGTTYVRTAAFSANGTRVGLASFEGGDPVRLFDTATGDSLFNLIGHTGLISTLAFSPDGTGMITASHDGTLILWDLSSGSKRWVLEGHEGAVTAAAFSADGRRIVSGGSDSNLKFWDPSRGVLLGTLRGHASQVTSVQFSPDSRRVLSSSADGTIRLWPADAVAVQLIYTGHEKAITDVAFSPDGARVVSCGSMDGTFQVWDASTGQRLCTLNDGYWAGSAEFSRDGQRILTSGSTPDPVKLWNAKTGHFLNNLDGSRESISWVRHSLDGKRMAAAGFSRDVFVWDTVTGNFLRAFPVREGDLVTDGLAFSPDSASIATCEDRATGQVRIWDAATGAQRKTLVGPLAHYRGVTFNPTGTRVAVSCQESSQVLVWNVETGECIQRLKGHSEFVKSITYSPDGKRLFTGGEDDTFRVWDSETGKELLKVEAGQNGVTSLALSPNGKSLVTAGADGTVKLWETERISSTTRQHRELVQIASDLVNKRFAEFMYLDETVNSIRKDTSINQNTKALAIEIALAHGESVKTLQNSAFWIVLDKQRTPIEYRRALRQAEAANRSSHGFGGIPFTYALAQYRNGHYQAAYDTLILHQSPDIKDPPSLSMLAMILYRLDRIDEAKAALTKAQNSLPFVENADVRKLSETLINEASNLMNQ
jgi:WD40 repeat protein